MCIRDRWLGVERVIGTAACGSLNPEMDPGALVIVDQFIDLSLIHISEPTRLLSISYAVFCLKKKKTNKN